MAIMGGVARIGLRRSTQSNWETVDPVLAEGELGYETDTLKLKAGDGSTKYSNLPYLNVNDVIFLDIDDDGTSDIDSIAEIATAGDSYNVVTNPSGSKLLIDFSKKWPLADQANSLGSGAVDAIGEIASNIRTGVDSYLVTGTAGTGGNITEWNADGDLVDSGSSLSDFIQTPSPGAGGELAEWDSNGDVIGSRLEKVAQISLDSTSSAIVTIPTGKNVVFEFIALTNDAGASVDLYAQLSDDGGSSFYSSGYDNRGFSASGNVYSQADIAQMIPSIGSFVPDTNTSKAWSGTFVFVNDGNGDRIIYGQHGADADAVHAGFYLNRSALMDTAKFYLSSGGFSEGDLIVWAR